jgi:nucleoside phosphorylase
MQKDICIFASLKRETREFLGRLESPARAREGDTTVYRGIFRGRRVRVVRAGIGRRETSRETIGECGLLISTGFCGGLAEDLSPGDLVLAREVAFLSEGQIDMLMEGAAGGNPWKRFPLVHSAVWRDVETLLREGGLLVRTGRTVTAERVIGDPGEKRALARYFDALSVDMEDFFRLSEAASLGVPAVSLRAVLDTASVKVPRLGGFRGSGPGEWAGLPGRLASLKRAMDLAGARLAEALAAACGWNR